VTDLLKSTIDRKITISVEKHSENFKVSAEHTGLQNVLLNLGINAGHAMPDGGEIRISTQDIELNQSYCDVSHFDLKPGKYCKIEMLDTGTGIPLEHQKKIFEPFYTTKGPGKGTGLGLAAVYGTIMDLCGEIKVYSELGEGTSFHILLPITDGHIEETENHKDIFHGSGLILLVDDEELIRITGKDMLEDMGYDVILAENGKLPDSIHFTPMIKPFN